MIDTMRLVIRLFAPAALLALFSMYAQAQLVKPITPNASAPLNLRKPSKLMAIEPADDSLKALDYIVAVVDNEPITNLEVNSLAAMVDPAANKIGRESLLREALENLINESAQLQMARQMNMHIAPAEITDGY